MNFLKLSVWTAVLFLIANLAHADCTLLAGDYDCLDDYDDPAPLSLSFPTADTVLLKDSGDEDLLHYNLWTPLQNNADLIQREARVSCKNDDTGPTLITEYKAIDINSRGVRTGILHWENTWKMIAGQLVVHSEGELIPDKGEKIPLVGDFTCTIKKK